MRSEERLLKTLCADEYSIRLDWTDQWFSTQASRFSVCGVHLATDREVSGSGYLENAIVPDRPQPLGLSDLSLLSLLLADTDTPSGLCLEIGDFPLPAATLAEILAEAQSADFKPHYGSLRTIGPYEGRLIDVLVAQPNTMTTTVLDPRIRQYSETRRGTWVGMHYDNAWTTSGYGERFQRKDRVQSADRRLLYNVGPGARRLVVALNMTAMHLSEKVRPDDGTNIPDTRQLQTYLRDHPDEVDSVTCLVVTLHPGDYAVFPAGIAIHDGSMDNLSEPSTAIVLGGRFLRQNIN